MTDKVYKNMQKHGKNLSSIACKDSDAVFLKETNSDIRTPYFRDIDKILYSLSYVRYMGKTQVFTFRGNDHIQKRMLHVQLVSKIARTIGRALGLNEDLIEAAALGHDLGHTPFGHEGERILNLISHDFGEGNFYHNLNSVRNLMYIENYGQGLNISMQVLDAIMCHNGELVSNEYYPKLKTQEDFLNEYFDCFKNRDTAKYLRPMTLEGCVVRISDIIAYIGRDIEDAVRMNLLKFEDIPEDITSVLGSTNAEIVNTIVCDIIDNSLDKPYIKLSDEVFNALKNLMSFNYKYIYIKSLTDDNRKEIEDMFRLLANSLLEDLKNNNEESLIYSSYLNNMSDEYKENRPERIVIDYIAGMTDEYFLKQYNSLKSKN